MCEHCTYTISQEDMVQMHGTFLEQCIFDKPLMNILVLLFLTVELKNTNVINSKHVSTYLCHHQSSTVTLKLVILILNY